MALGRAFAEELKPGSVVAFDAPLGAGKTTFVKGMGEGLGIREIITSPTFTIISEYPGNTALYHMDFYRVKDEEELALLGVEEYLYGSGICAVEWSGVADALLPPSTIRISIKILETGARSVSVNEV